MLPRIKSYFTLLFLLTFLSASPMLAQVKLSMALIDTDDINKPPCKGIPSVCFSTNNPFILTLDIDPLTNLNFSLKVSLWDDNNLLWKAQPGDITKVGTSGGITTFDVDVDLGSTGFVGSALLVVEAVSITGPGGIVSNTGGSGRGGLFGSNSAGGRMKWVCVRNDCDAPVSIKHPCECEKKSLGFGIEAGEQLPGLGGEGTGELSVNQFQANFGNKFFGLAFYTTGKTYYQAEVLITSLDFTEMAPISPASTGIETAHSLVHLRVVPLHFRRQIGRIGSIGAGGGLGLLMQAKMNDQKVITLSESNNNYDRLEPEAFVDVRFGNPVKGLNVGLRYGYRFGGIQNVTGSGYSVGKLYLSFGFL